MKNSITKYEKIFLYWLNARLVFICVIALLLLSVAIRIPMFSYISGDMSFYLVGWYEQIIQLGRMKALSTQVGNYNVLYQTLIVLLTYFPGDVVLKYKVLSCIFDYILAFAVFNVLYDRDNKETKHQAVISALIVLFMPVVFMNSAVWGQCDAAYVSFAILAYSAYIKKKYPLCFFLYGISFAFKLQAIFFLPFFLYRYVKDKEFSILHFLLTPLAMIVVCIPAYINGRGFKGFISPYYYQLESCNKMSFNYPNFWTVISTNPDMRADFLDTMKVPAIFLTISVLITIMIVSLRESKYIYSAEWCFFIMAYTCVCFLPGMHERYGFAMEIFSVIYAIKDRSTIPLAIMINIITIITYGAELFGGVMNLSVLGLFNVLVYAMYFALPFVSERGKEKVFG